MTFLQILLKEYTLSYLGVEFGGIRILSPPWNMPTKTGSENNLVVSQDRYVCQSHRPLRLSYLLSSNQTSATHNILHVPWGLGRLPLYNISSDIIRQFGLKYYIRTALEELTKQKGKLFAPDELSSLQKEFSIDYETYLQKQSTHNIESIQQNISKLHKKPKFSFILIIDGHSTLENIKQSLDSISDQFYENFNLYLIILSTAIY